MPHLKKKIANNIIHTYYHNSVAKQCTANSYRTKHTWNKFHFPNNPFRQVFHKNRRDPRPSFKILLRRNIMSRLLASFLSRLLSKLARARNKFLPRLGARKIFSKQKRRPQTRFYATATRSDFPGRNLFRRMIVRFFSLFPFFFFFFFPSASIDFVRMNSI